MKAFKVIAKRIYFAFLISLTVFSGCGEAKFTQKNSMSSSEETESHVKETESEELFHFSVQASADAEKLEMNWFGENVLFRGNKIESDRGIGGEDVQEMFQGLLGGKILPGDLTEIVLQFSDSIPDRLVWYSCYLDSDGSMIYSGLNDNTKGTSVEHIEKTVNLPIGMNLAPGLDSSPGRIVYRYIRIVCTYEEQTMEYNILLDGTLSADRDV